MPQVDLSDLELHLRCHGDLLFRCAHCDLFHWQKRVVDAHVAEAHPGKKHVVRDVRKEAEAARANRESGGAAAAAPQKVSYVAMS
jgi:hypothetical protein